MTADELAELERYLTPAERAELNAILDADIREIPWTPLPGPQSLAYESRADIIGYGGAAGGGKGLALDTLLPTPAGFVSMGAVAPGDTLFGPDGAPCTVTAVSEVSVRPCYRLTFDDGATLVADDVHRWVTFDAKELAQLTRKDPAWRAARRASRPSRAKGPTNPARRDLMARPNTRDSGTPPPAGSLRDTADLARTLRTAAGRANHAIEVARQLAAPAAVLPVPPYTLGAWLGDGSSRNGQLTGEDPGIWERIEGEGFVVRHYTWDRLAHNILGLRVRLRTAGVLANKHIPAAYLRASPDQRLALLQGLMDTDGHAATDGGCEFDGVNERLVRGVLDLVLSLGIKATLQTGVARLNGRAVSLKWRVKFTTSLPVFGLPRKLVRLKPASALRRTSRFRYLVGCEPVASVPTRCIAVDSPSRQFLATPHLIATHNTDLAAGTILTKSERALFIRREKAQTEGVVQRLQEIIGSTSGYSSQKGAWRIPGAGLLELGGLDNPGDERRWQGRPHDKKLFDEVTEMREQQVRFIMGWTRTDNPDLHAQVIMTFNPPTTAEGRWVIAFFAPWLDPKFPGPRAKPGELRYAAMLPDGNGGAKDVWLDRGDPFVLVGGKPRYDFDPTAYRPEDIIQPKSRTFIPARLTDNPIYMATGYMSTLQSLPEPLRSQMLYGDFMAGVEDGTWQLIPTKWVELAQARWVDRSPKGEMLQQGVDVARGGRDSTIISNRHYNTQAANPWWFDRLKELKGVDTDDGDKCASQVLVARRDDAPINLDVIGVGASPYDSLKRAKAQVWGVNVSERPMRATDKTGVLKFLNLRADLWWGFRELLDPLADTGIALPPDPDLLEELCGVLWRPSGKFIAVESREEIVKRIGRSPDRATAVILASIDQPKEATVRAASGRALVLEHDPYARAEHDPYA